MKRIIALSVVIVLIVAAGCTGNPGQTEQVTPSESTEIPTTAENDSSVTETIENINDTNDIQTGNFLLSVREVGGSYNLSRETKRKANSGDELVEEKTLEHERIFVQSTSSGQDNRPDIVINTVSIYNDVQSANNFVSQFRENIKTQQGTIYENVSIGYPAFYGEYTSEGGEKTTILIARNKATVFYVLVSDQTNHYTKFGKQLFINQASKDLDLS